MTVDSDGYRFDFTDALDAFKFDEKEKANPNFHGAPMKAVDVIAEFADSYLFVEIKEYNSQDDFDPGSENDKDKRDNFSRLKGYLKYKYRDTYLYRYAEEKTDKQVHYVCLLNFDDALNTVMRKNLVKELPVGFASRRWVRSLAQSCQVLNLAAWNRNFPKWPAHKLGKE